MYFEPNWRLHWLFLAYISLTSPKLGHTNFKDDMCFTVVDYIYITSQLLISFSQLLRSYFQLLISLFSCPYPFFGCSYHFSVAYVFSLLVIYFSQLPISFLSSPYIIFSYGQEIEEYNFHSNLAIFPKCIVMVTLALMVFYHIVVWGFLLYRGMRDEIWYYSMKIWSDCPNFLAIWSMSAFRCMDTNLVFT